MKTKILIALLGLAFFSCSDSSKKDITARKRILNSDTKYYPSKYCPYCYLGVISDPNEIVSFLNDSSDLESKGIGLEGRYSERYAQFERLSEIASDTTLLRLTHHSNSKIRVYAMWALIEKNRSLALKELPRFKNDNSTVIYYSSDTKSPMPVSLLVAGRFEPSETKIKYVDSSGFLKIKVF